MESVRRFPSQGDVVWMIAEAGFAIGGDFEGDGGAWRGGTYGVGLHVYEHTPA